MLETNKTYRDGKQFYQLVETNVNYHGKTEYTLNAVTIQDNLILVQDNIRKYESECRNFKECDINTYTQVRTNAINAIAELNKLAN